MSGLLTNNNIVPSCNYAQLGAYNQGFRGIRPPVPLTAVSGYYVVPAYSAITLDPPMDLVGNYWSRLGSRVCCKTREIAAQNTLP